DSQVILSLSVDQKTALRIQQDKSKKGEPGIAAFGGVVKAVDAAKNTITVANKGGEQTFSVAKDASISAEGKPRQLANVPVESHVSMSLSEDRKTVLSIQASGPQVPGVVRAVDPAGNTITIANKAGEKSFTIAKDVSVSLDGKPARLADVPVAAPV